MLLLLLKQEKHEDEPTRIRHDPILEQILHYIDEHPTEKITAATLSARFFVSTSWLVHTFRRVLDITLMQYVEKKRIVYAQGLIRKGRSPVEVADHCGYESYVTFYRQYKKILERTPKEDALKKTW